MSKEHSPHPIKEAFKENPVKGLAMMVFGFIEAVKNMVFPKRH
jgi:hypothetical protein